MTVKTKHFIILVTLSSLLLASCTADKPEPTVSHTPLGSLIVSYPDTTPYPTAIPGLTASLAAPPTPVPPVSVIPSTSTTATSMNAGWTRYVSINDIYDLAFAPDGTLWAITGGGLVHWDLTTETYTRHLLRATDIAVVPDGSLWIATEHGICHFNGATCRTYTDADGLINNTVRAVAVAPDGTVWVGTQSGVSRFDGVAWKSYPAPVPTEDLAVAPNGEVWHATAAGVGRYSPSQDAWTTFGQGHGLPHTHASVIAIGPDGEVWAYILWYGVYRFEGENWLPVGEVPGGIVADIAFASDGTPWVGTRSSLLYREAEEWTDVTTAHGLMSSRAIALGPEGVVAASTHRGLVLIQGGQLRLLRDGPASDRVMSVAVTPDGAAWFAFGDSSGTTPGVGISRFDGRDWGYYLHDAQVYALAVAPDGTLWAGVGCDVQRFDGVSWDTVARCEEDLPFGNVLDIAFAQDGAVWVANGFSVARFDGRSWKRYEKLIDSLVAAPDGGIWVNGWEGTQGSGYVARFEGETWRTFKSADSFPGAFRVGGVTEDGCVWGVVPERGLACFDGGTWEDGQSWRFYASPGGFGLVGVVAVAPDGALWLTTDDGVARFDPSSARNQDGEGDPWQAWTIYTEADGLVSYYSSVAFGPDDEIWFGLTRFQPTQADTP